MVQCGGNLAKKKKKKVGLCSVFLLIGKIDFKNLFKGFLFTCPESFSKSSTIKTFSKTILGKLFFKLLNR